MPYVTIWVENQDAGTTSNEQGVFTITHALQDNLIFSTVGYERLVCKFSEKIVLKKRIYELEEVVITTPKFEHEFEIDTQKPKYNSRYVFDNFFAIAKFFPYDSSYSETKFIKKIVCFTKSDVENATFKIRLFSVDEQGLPKDDLLQEDIIVTAKKGRRKNTIDLSKHKFIFPIEGFFVVYEAIDLPSNKYKYKYVVDNQSTEKTAYAPGIMINHVTKQNTYVNIKSKWGKKYPHHSSETKKSLLSFNGKVSEPAIGLILSN